eukprot:scaffold50550_cov60-Phaeocystis_antarctica.AAC.2
MSSTSIPSSCPASGSRPCSRSNSTKGPLQKPPLPCCFRHQVTASTSSGSASPSMPCSKSSFPKLPASIIVSWMLLPKTSREAANDSRQSGSASASLPCSRRLSARLPSAASLGAPRHQHLPIERLGLREPPLLNQLRRHAADDERRAALLLGQPPELRLGANEAGLQLVEALPILCLWCCHQLPILWRCHHGNAQFRRVCGERAQAPSLSGARFWRVEPRHPVWRVTTACQVAGTGRGAHPRGAEDFLGAPCWRAFFSFFRWTVFIKNKQQVETQ